MLNSLSLQTTLVTLLGLFTFALLPSFAAADSDDYVYKQSFMPRDANRLAAARPIPLAAPVTTATRSVASTGFVMFETSLRNLGRIKALFPEGHGY